jgi:CRP-like cAMP-binding protein
MAMPLTLRTQPSLPNRLLSALSKEEYERLASGSERVRLTPGRVLFEAGEEVRHAYFPLSGMASLLSSTQDGRSVEVAVVGSEGMLGIPVVLSSGRSPYRVMAQLPTEALMIRAGALRSGFELGGRLRELVLRHALALLTQISQSAVCHRFHSIEQRLARWLLVTRDRAGADSFRLTQEFLSYMLGVPRTSVTATAVSFQRAGLIDYSRGRITLLDARGLEAASCECYRVVMREIEQLLAA